MDFTMALQSGNRKYFALIPYDIFDSKHFEGLPKCKHYALLDLYRMKAFEPYVFHLNNKPIQVEENQLITFYGTLGSRWGVSKKVVKTWLDFFEKYGYIKTRRDNNGTLITVLITVDKKEGKSQNQPKSVTPRSHQGNTGCNTEVSINKDNKDKEIKRGEGIPPDVSIFWKNYTNTNDPVPPNDVGIIKRLLEIKSVDEWKPIIKKMKKLDGKTKTLRFFEQDYYQYDTKNSLMDTYRCPECEHIHKSDTPDLYSVHCAKCLSNGSKVQMITT